MCKHILITNFKKEDMTSIYRFADLTSDRDGYGAIARMKNGEIKTIKSLNIAEFYTKLAGIVALKVSELVVHYRTSTNERGVDYAHPFEFQGNYLTHNGVVTVPGKHETKTRNDSEALLHHLIKTNYDTESISGYFSCFILNDTGTTVLVDDTAPIYTDGRIYCSHNLNGEMKSVALKKIVISAGISKEKIIKVTKTSYGLDKSYLSLGSGSYKHQFYGEDYSDLKDTYYDKGADAFFTYLAPSDERHIENCLTYREAKDMIKMLADEMCIQLTKKDVKEVLRYTWLLCGDEVREVIKHG